jgi:hypothetical protein
MPQSKKERDKITKIKYRATKRGHLSTFLEKAKERAKTKNISFDLTLDFLESIATNECPVFKTPFVWGRGKGRHPYQASLDKIIPELGYVKNNVVFISHKANLIKQDVTEKELYLVADWLHKARKNVLNAQTNTTTPVPAGSDQQVEIYPELGSFSATGTWQNSNNLDNHSGTIQRQDTDHRAQASSGDGVGYGGAEVGAPQASQGIEDDWQLHPAYGWIKS